MTETERADPGASVREVRRLAGHAAFRKLLRHYWNLSEQAGAEMHILAHEVAEAGLPAALQVRRVRLAGGAVRQRLFWRMRGDANIVPFECVRESFSRIPAPFHGYLEACRIRVQELNAIEAIFRHAAGQIEMYLAHGTVKATAGGAARRRRQGRPERSPTSPP